MRWLVTLAALGLILPCWCAAADLDADQRAAAEFFEKKIRPLLIQRCDECHSTQKADESGHLALDNRASLLAGGTRGPVLAPGKPDDSLLIKAVKYLDPQLQMPPEGKLADAEIELLSRWIKEGAFVPDYGKSPGKAAKEIDWTSARKFWSFRPLAQTTPPAIAPDSVVRNPIDAYVLQKLAGSGLNAAPQADRRTLIRRLSFDLLGLPPTSDEVAEYIGDDRPDATERLVDRLLASPQFGERWARYWLDLARYVDFTPDWQKNTDRAWMYRDWVVRAFNEDRPYDEFARSQLAADLVADSDPRDIAALGFLGVSPTYWKELRLAPSVIEVIVADEWDERLDTVSRTFLGLTVACARCHDHKFDPVTTRDYYALAGIFASTQVADRPLLPASQADQVIEARGKLDKLQDAFKKVKEKESEEAKMLQRQMDELRSSTPQIDALMAPVVEDSSVYVVADGPDATKLEFRKGQSRDLPVFRRGNPANPGDVVTRRFLELFTQATPDGSNAIPNPSFQKGSGRLELADALLTSAKPLTARVIVNRLWLHHFGRGLVKTPGDFGNQGEAPTHPELLEWLAGDLTGPGRAWSLKHLHRQIVSSATYGQSSVSAGSQGIDPDNALLSHMNRRRLEIEPWRDAMLATASNLNDQLGGPGMDLDQKGHLRRTLYGRIGRDEQNDMLRIYDFPPPTTHSPVRDATTTPLQQLFVFNSDFVEQQATVLASRLLEPRGQSTADRIDRCYLTLFQRLPRDSERSLGARFLAAAGDQVPELNRWRWYVQSLYGLNEFLFVD